MLFLYYKVYEKFIIVLIRICNYVLISRRFIKKKDILLILKYVEMFNFLYNYWLTKRRYKLLIHSVSRENNEFQDKQ